MIMLIISIKQIIHINNFNFDEKSLIYFENFDIKEQITLIFLKFIKLKKLKDQFDILKKNREKK